MEISTIKGKTPIWAFNLYLLLYQLMELGSTWFKMLELADLKQESVWGEVAKRKKRKLC